MTDFIRTPALLLPGPSQRASSLIIPIAIICRLAITLPSIADFRVIEMVSCRLWYWMNDPSSIPPDGHIPSALCAIPGVNEYYATIITLIVLGDGIGSEFHSLKDAMNLTDLCILAIFGFSAASFFASRMGRIPVLLGFIAISMAGQAFIMGSQFVQGWLQLSFLALWAASQILINPWTTIFILNIYIVDVVQAEDR